MRIHNITYDEINNLNERKINTRFGFTLYVNNNLFYKLNMEKSLPVILCKLEKKLDMLEEAGVFSMEEVCAPLKKIYHNDSFIGYTTVYLTNYANFIEKAKSLKNSKKIDLLIQLSKAIKKLHERNIVHSDIKGDNVLSDGHTIKIVDFDDSHYIRHGEDISFYDSYYIDIKCINDLVFILLTTNDFGRMKKNQNISFPKEVRNYINFFYRGVKSETIKAVMPSEYPHDWLDELKDYIGEYGSFQKRI